MGIMARKGLTKFIIERWGPPKKMLFLLAYCFMTPSEGSGVTYKKSALKSVENSFQGRRY